jgi:hypothetical protein
VRFSPTSQPSIPWSDQTAPQPLVAHRLATIQVPATAFAYQANGQFLSPRLGCRIFPPFGYGVDLAALCLPHS